MDLIAPTRRLHVTEQGLERLAWELGVDLADVLDRYPVSAHWQRVLLGRLDAVGSIYRLAAAIADARGPVGLRWYRNAPMDTAVVLSDGGIVGSDVGQDELLQADVAAAGGGRGRGPCSC